MRFTTSRADTWISPRQSRYNDWRHGKIEPMDELKHPIRASLMGFSAVVAVLTAMCVFAVMVGGKV